MSPSLDNKKPSQKTGGQFSAEEKAAMRERAKELKAESNKAGAEKTVLAAIEAMNEPERSIAMRLHEIIKVNAPGLLPKTWYGMPAYANKEGKVICFFQAAQKFNTRYATLGFSDSANLDEGCMWATSFALKELTETEEARVIALIQKAIS